MEYKTHFHAAEQSSFTLQNNFKKMNTIIQIF